MKEGESEKSSSDDFEEGALKKPNLRQSQKEITLSNDKIHTLKNIVQGIIGYAEILMVTPDLPIQVYNDIQMVYELGLDAIGVIRQIPESSDKSGFEYERTDLTDVIQEISESIEEQVAQDIDVIINNEETSFDCDLDRTSFKRALTDIILYVFRLDSNTTNVTITLTPVEIDASDYEGPDEPPESWMEIRILAASKQEIKDDHLPLEMLIANKDRFLDVVEPKLIGSYQSIRRHGGHAFRLGEENKVTGFAVLVPRLTAPLSDAEEIQSTPDPFEAGKEESKLEDEITDKKEVKETPAEEPYILVVDDDKVVLAVVVGMLEQLGYRAIRATSADDALEIFEKQHNSILLVMLDVVMPKMDGLDVLAYMKEVDHTTPIILMTGYFSDISEEEIEELGISGWIEKPMNITRLEHTIAGALEKENHSGE